MQQYATSGVLAKCWNTIIWLQQSVSIQPRTSLLKFWGKFLFFQSTPSRRRRQSVGVGRSRSRMVGVPTRYTFVPASKEPPNENEPENIGLTLVRRACRPECRLWRSLLHSLWRRVSSPEYRVSNTKCRVWSFMGRSRNTSTSNNIFCCWDTSSHFRNRPSSAVIDFTSLSAQFQQFEMIDITFLRSGCHTSANNLP